MVRSGAILYFRLNEFDNLQVPPLRQRREDIPYLAKHFLDIANLELSKSR
jgi:transcriptional regulator with GAF, ATPase, and Fis domain